MFNFGLSPTEAELALMEFDVRSGRKSILYRLILRGEKLKRLMKKCVRGVSFYTLITSLIEKGILL